MAKKKLVEPERLDENNALDVARRIGEYRRQEISSTILKQWIIDAGNKLNVYESEIIIDLPDSWLIDTWAYVGRMYTKGLVHKDSNVQKLRKAILDMVNKTKEIKEEQKNKPSPMKIVQDQVDEIYESLEPRLDDPNLDIVSVVQQLGISDTHITKLAKKIEKKEVKEQLEKYLEKNKPKSKSRKKKTKTPEEICKLFKCLEEYDGVKGYKAEDVLGGKCAVVYHTQKKTITFYFGDKLGIHRSIITDFNEEQSGEYKLENKEHLNIKGKVKIDGVYNTEYKDKKKKVPTGRVTNKMIIIGKY